MTQRTSPHESWRRHYLVALVPSVLVGSLAVSRILARAGEAALPLDDSFIHLQYAARLAEGAGFEYTRGAGYSSGATSFAWPLAFVPFFWMGLRGLDLVWVAWSLGVFLHAAVAYETWRLGRGLLGPNGALAAGAMCSAFGPFAWFAWSGMETMALAWLLVRTARVAAEHAEEARSPVRRSTVELAVLGFVTPLVRPEGALASALACATLARDLRFPSWRLRAGTAGLVALLGPVVVPVSHRLATGHSASSTAMVKHLAFDPYRDAASVFDATLANAALLVTDLLDGGRWTAEFLPAHVVWWLAGGLVALPLLARDRGARWRAFLIVALAAGTLGPTTYATLLWNRVRYIWPFAPAWWLIATALFVAVGERLARWRPMAGTVGPALAWGLVAMLAAKIDGTTADLATSARAISRQQVQLGRWAAAHLTDDALIGVNDTGAIAYLSGRKTFDVVGLTTEGEAPYWAWGAGARFEHWERRHANGNPLPTHLIVYREWMAMPAVEGEWLTEATVIDQSILGGRTMTAMTLDDSLLGSGERPFSGEPGPLLGQLDVADIESERAHGYVLGDAKAWWCVAARGASHDGRTVADGGRLERTEDRFILDADAPATLVMRGASDEELEVLADGRAVGRTTVVARGRPWEERRIDLPAGIHELTVRHGAGRRFASHHYWWFAR